MHVSNYCHNSYISNPRKLEVNQPWEQVRGERQALNPVGDKGSGMEDGVRLE